jgi:DNA polymerase III delta prime subunit
VEKVVNSIWVEKYRPRKIKELVLPEEYLNDFEENIKKQEISHLLFSGPPGSGKTCVAQIFCSKDGIIKNSNDNVLTVDGSSKECRGITFVQDVIEQYLKIPPALPDKYKIVFIDEADQLTEASFKSLRHIMEKYSIHGRFILTCNYISKIEDAVQSRCQHYTFKQMPTEFVFNYCKNILEKESITFDEKDIKYIITSLYPDIRKIVNSIQRRCSTGKLILDRSNILTSEKILISYFVEIVNFIQNNEDHKINGVINNIVKLLGELDLDYRTIYNDLFFRNEIPTTAKIIINKYSNSHNDCLLPNMHWMAMLFEVVQGLQKYKQLVGKK